MQKSIADLTDEELRKLRKDTVEKANEEKEEAKSQALSYSDIQLTDTGNAQNFIRQYGLKLHYCEPWKSWIYWNDRYWERDERHGVESMAKEFVHGLYNIAWMGQDEKLSKWAFKSQSRRKIEDFLSLARSEPGIPVMPEEFDKNKWLLNLGNGTYDLEIDRFRDHRRADGISKIIPISYDPEAICPTWDDFLERIMDGNEELIGFLQRAVGYCLSGNTSEQCFFILYGSGMNGKSTFISTLLRLFSDYGGQLRSESLLVQRFDQIPSDIARMKGVRFVAVQETPQNSALNESLIKALTGSDKVTARERYRDEFEYWPQYKIWLSTNHRPTIRGVDYAIWRRSRLIPFNIVIPPPEQDKNLVYKLTEEIPGILLWAIRGMRQWKEKKDLCAPSEVLRATQEYRSDMDVLGDFYNACCVNEGDVLNSELYEAYKQWAETNGERVKSNRWFTFRMRERDFKQKHTHLGMLLWLNISLKEE